MNYTPEVGVATKILRRAPRTNVSQPPPLSKVVYAHADGSALRECSLSNDCNVSEIPQTLILTFLTVRHTHQ